MNLSVVIITKNEEHNIERCIRSCLSLNAEILVLDSQSTDQTVSIAEGLGAQVHSIEWRGYGATKNHGAALAQHNWILSLDADEALDENIQKNILEAVQETSVTGYWLRRSFIFNGKQLFYGALKNEKRLRLYQKDHMHWNLNAVHEDLVSKKNAIEPVLGTLQGGILHYSYRDLDDMRKRLNKYAALSAQKLAHKSAIYLKLKKAFAPTFSFLKNYVVRKGFLDGKEGLVFAKEQAQYVRKKYQFALKHTERGDVSTN